MRVRYSPYKPCRLQAWKPNLRSETLQGRMPVVTGSKPCTLLTLCRNLRTVRKVHYVVVLECYSARTSSTWYYQFFMSGAMLTTTPVQFSFLAGRLGIYAHPISASLLLLLPQGITGSNQPKAPIDSIEYLNNSIRFAVWSNYITWSTWII
jgi:hypothetical protein